MRVTHLEQEVAQIKKHRSAQRKSRTKRGVVQVAIMGYTNAGKSTLLNRIVGQKLAITSPKPQSTRDRVVGIRSTDDTQMVVLDTPGLLEPRYALHAAMRGTAMTALRDADVVLYLVDATEGEPAALEDVAGLSAAERPRAPVVLLVCKEEYRHAGFPDYDIFTKLMRRFFAGRADGWRVEELAGRTHREVAELMSEAEIAEAQREARAWMTTH